MLKASIKTYQLNSFTGDNLLGNPAGVVILDNWISEDLMQQIARENNLPNTAFLVGNRADYTIRFFTPKNEVELCGHASLAASSIIFKQLEITTDSITFQTKARIVNAKRNKDDSITLEFPIGSYQECEIPDNAEAAFGYKPMAAYQGNDRYILVYDNQAIIKNIEPNFVEISKIPGHGVCITSIGDNNYDFVSRFFAPKYGVDEDPVTGSMHCILVKFWAERLGKNDLKAYQASPRGGEIICRLTETSVLLTGRTQQSNTH